MLRPLCLCVLLAGCAAARPANRADDLSLPDTFLTALQEGRFDEARAVALRLQAAGRLGASLRARLWLGKRLHDPALVRAVAADPHVFLLKADAMAQEELARAVLSVSGFVEAAPYFDAVCADARLGVSSRSRTGACELAELGARARSRPFAIEGAPRATLDLVTRRPLPMVAASLNGRPPEAFVVDTGVRTSLLSRTSCEAAGVPATQSVALVAELQLGGLVVRNFFALVVDLPPQLGFVGILSPEDVLQGVLVELDGRELKLRLYRDLDEDGWRRLVAEPVHAAPLAWSDAGMFVRGRVGEALQGWLLVDFGAGAGMVSREAAKQLGQDPEKPGNFTTSVTVGDARPRREEVAAIDGSDADGELRQLGAIGFPWTLGRRVALSRDGTQLLFTESTLP
jgi:hypothetical protein